MFSSNAKNNIYLSTSGFSLYISSFYFELWFFCCSVNWTPAINNGSWHISIAYMFIIVFFVVVFWSAPHPHHVYIFSICICYQTITTSTLKLMLFHGLPYRKCLMFSGIFSWEIGYMQFDLLINNLKPHVIDHPPLFWRTSVVYSILLLFHKVPSTAYKAVLIPKPIPSKKKSNLHHLLECRELTMDRSALCTFNFFRHCVGELKAGAYMKVHEKYCLIFQSFFTK